MSRKESASRRQVAGEGSPVHSHPEAVWKGWIDAATTKGEALIDRLARPSWDAGRLRGLRTLPPLKNKKAIQSPPGRWYIPPSLWEWQGNGNSEVERVAHFGRPPELGPLWRSIWAFVCLPNKNKPSLGKFLPL